MKKWILRALVLGAAISTLAAPASSQLNSEIERIGAAILSEKLGFPVDEILGVSDRYDTSVYDLAPMFAIERETHRSTDEIWRLRKSGMGWGNIAKRLGIHPGTFNKMRVRGDFDNDWRWDDIMRDRYGWSDSQIRSRRSKGQRWSTIFVEAERSKGRRSGSGRTVISSKGHSGSTSHGKSGTSHGKSGTTHGKSGTSHGKSGGSHGKSGDDHGKSGGSHGKSGGSHGKSGGGHGRKGG